MKKMTIFYKLKTLEIVAVVSGIQNLGYFADMDMDVVELIYGMVFVELDTYIISHRKEFELIKNDVEELKLQMKDELKQRLQKYL